MNKILLLFLGLFPFLVLADDEKIVIPKDVYESRVAAAHSVALAYSILEWKDAPNLTKQQRESMYHLVVSSLPLWFNLHVQLKNMPRDPQTLRFRNQYFRLLKRLLEKVSKTDILNAFKMHRASFTDSSISVRWPLNKYGKEQFELDLKKFVALAEED